MTLAEKVYETGIPDGAPQEIVREVEELPEEALGSSRDREEMDEHHLRQWFLFFGIGYAIARSEQPFASDEAWQALAREAASKVTRWHDTVGGKPEGES